MCASNLFLKEWASFPTNVRQLSSNVYIVCCWRTAGSRWAWVKASRLYSRTETMCYCSLASTSCMDYTVPFQVSSPPSPTPMVSRPRTSVWSVSCSVSQVSWTPLWWDFCLTVTNATKKPSCFCAAVQLSPWLSRHIPCPKVKSGCNRLWWCWPERPWYQWWLFASRSPLNWVILYLNPTLLVLWYQWHRSLGSFW